MPFKELQDLPLFAQFQEHELYPSKEQLPVQQQGPPKQLTVSELTAQIKGVVEPAFLQVWVSGEISNYRPAPSGHAYFSLKDSSCCIQAAAFGWNNKKKNFSLKDGTEVLCRGKVAIYPPRGQYQLVVDQIEPLGAGALQLAFEQLKDKLYKEGLFDPARKRDLPRYPSRIVVITSPTGAAIQDILHVLKRRAPQVQVLLISALVQGDEAPAQLIKALQTANEYQLGDLIVLARGGGSMEDLWCFNHEALARAIASSILPVISAVGHEIDFTIADFVSDLRAPTPSAAAEILTRFWMEAVGQVHEAGNRLADSMIRGLQQRTVLLSHIAARVLSPSDRLREQMQQMDDWLLRLERAMRVTFERKQSDLEQCSGKLDALSPLKVLERGYALVREKGQTSPVIRSAEQLHTGQELEVHFYDGKKSVKVI